MLPDCYFTPPPDPIHAIHERLDKLEASSADNESLRTINALLIEQRDHVYARQSPTVAELDSIRGRLKQLTHDHGCALQTNSELSRSIHAKELLNRSLTSDVNTLHDELNIVRNERKNFEKELAQVRMYAAHQKARAAQAENALRMLIERVTPDGYYVIRPYRLDCGPTITAAYLAAEKAGEKAGEA